MGRRWTPVLPVLVLVLLAPSVSGCALLMASPIGARDGGAPSPVVVAASPMTVGSTPGNSTTSEVPPSVDALPTPERLATLLGPADFTSVGVTGAGAPTANGEPGSAFVVYAGVSSGGGGIEMDAFVLDTLEAAAAMVTDPGLFALDDASKLQMGAERATFIDSQATNDGTSTYDDIRVQRGRLVVEIGIPTTATSRDQLIVLATLVLSRSTEYQ
jgi:hypothetical protein